ARVTLHAARPRRRPWRLTGLRLTRSSQYPLRLVSRSGSPRTRVGHRRPWLLLRLGLALLQKLDRYAVGRADERHTAVPGRPVDRHARLHQAIAGGVDVVDLVGEVAEVAAGAVRLRIPIVRQLNKRRTLRLG